VRRLASIIIYGLILSFSAFAHPHMYLVSNLEFEYEGTICTGFWEEWALDPMFSASIVHDLDGNANGKLDGGEADKVYAYAFINLKKYGFFTYIRRGSTRFSPSTVERFSATLRDSRLIYRFFVPLSKEQGSGPLAIAIFDTTYFCATSYEDVAAVVRQALPGAAIPSWSRLTNKHYPVFYNPTGAATDGTVYSAWKPGLETAYPEEILVQAPSH